MFAAGDPLENVNGIFHYIGAKEETVYQVNQTPTKIDVTGITTDDVAETIAVGATWDFASHLTVAPADASVKWVLYSSATPAKATVVVTGVAAGTSVITATTVDGNYSVTATVTVTA
jgi:uncharacterized protein YjdB